MAEKKYNSLKIVIPMEILSILLSVAMVGVLSALKQVKTDQLISHCTLTLLAMMVACYQVRNEFVDKTMDYDNGAHPFRFFLCVFAGLLIAGISCFLPVGAWPFVFVFVMLSVFSNLRTGILVGMMLLSLTVMITGEALTGYLIYTLSGIFSATLFRRIDGKFNMVLAFVLSMLSLLFCETGCVILLSNSRPGVEDFVIPAANMIVTTTLLLGILAYFYSRVLYRYRVAYLTLNDTEHPLLQEVRSERKDAYMASVHIAYFGENIARALDLDGEAVKLLCYYRCVAREKLEELHATGVIPPMAWILLQEYFRELPIRTRETTVVLMTEAVIAKALERVSQGRKDDFIQEIDGILNPMLLEESLQNSKLGLGEFNTIKCIFKEAKLYYDFLR
ncbi:MAG: hypothetical protein IJ335_06145 [Lachnospiraceae bacterium]|nr:hypothetical protein [Lachnospiraceae bacterium]